MVEESYGLTDVGVAGLVDRVFRVASLDGERSLARSGTEFIGSEPLVDPLGALETIEACGGQDEGVALSGG
jgi:hypothetical protein